MRKLSRVLNVLKDYYVLVIAVIFVAVYVSLTVVFNNTNIISGILTEIFNNLLEGFLNDIK